MGMFVSLVAFYGELDLVVRIIVILELEDAASVYCFCCFGNVTPYFGSVSIVILIVHS